MNVKLCLKILYLEGKMIFCLPCPLWSSSICSVNTLVASGCSTTDFNQFIQILNGGEPDGFKS